MRFGVLQVVAPVEPKTNIGRHNLSPFAAASLLERNSNTPPHYKFHVPRAVDSITQEPPQPRSLYGSRVNSSATLPQGKEALLQPRQIDNQIHRDKDDGLAAILAAKIRTKAELKQVKYVIYYYLLIIVCRLRFNNNISYTRCNDMIKINVKFSTRSVQNCFIIQQLSRAVFANCFSIIIIVEIFSTELVILPQKHYTSIQKIQMLQKVMFFIISRVYNVN